MKWTIGSGKDVAAISP